MKYLTSAKENVHLFVEACVLAGLKHVVISPGSRNAPLTISFDEHPEISCTLNHDERSAAFFALGMALQLQEPVAVVCTSGSAVLNYFPAVAEAFYQSIPLVVISADRPQEWINHGDGQTIMQDQVFGKHVLRFLQLEDQDESESYQKFVVAETQKAFQTANGLWAGPVHINFSLEEPLYGTKEVETLPTDQLQKTSIEQTEIPVNWSKFQELWSKAGKKLVLCGQMPKNKALLEELKTMSDDPSVLIMVENTSNLHDMKFVHCIDRTIEHLDKTDERFIPEILVTLGGSVVSKKVKTLFRNWPISAHWRVGHAFPEMDTYRQLTESVACSPSAFIRKLNEAPRLAGNAYAAPWKNLDFIRQEKTQDFCEGAPFSDLKVFHLLNDCLPEMSVLHLGNSSVVRYAQLFDPIPSVTYQSNRGTSGIDGSMSTAAGAAYADSDTWHVHFTGDISFFYDSNALWNQHLTPNLRIFLINNSGGGIFKIIPGPKTTAQYEKYFVAKHHHSAEHLCTAFDINYFKATNENEVLQHMESFYTHEADGRPKLMEIFTDGDLNDGVLGEYFEGLK